MSDSFFTNTPDVPVILTRPADRNKQLAAALRRAGMTVCDAPALGITPMPAARPRPGAGSLCVFVSRQAVEAYFSVVNEPWPDGAWAGAVGEATAAALLDHVPQARLVAPEPGRPRDSESLLAAIEARQWPPANAYILRAQHGRDWLALQLQRRGWQVSTHALYKRTPLLWDAATCRILTDGAGFRILLLTSQEAFRSMERSLRAQGMSWPRQLHVVTLHERIVRPLQYVYSGKAAGTLRVTCSAPDDDALLQAISAAVRQHT